MVVQSMKLRDGVRIPLFDEINGVYNLKIDRHKKIE